MVDPNSEERWSRVAEAEASEASEARDPVPQTARTMFSVRKYGVSP